MYCSLLKAIKSTPEQSSSFKILVQLNLSESLKVLKFNVKTLNLRPNDIKSRLSLKTVLLLMFMIFPIFRIFWFLHKAYASNYT